MFSLLVLFVASCETTETGLQDGYGGYVNTQSPEDQERLNQFTNDGRDIIPSAERITAAANDVGDICYDCSASDVASTRNTSGRSTYPTALKNYPNPSRGCIPLEDVSLSQARAAMQSQNITFATSGTDAQTGLRIQAPSEQSERTLGAAILRVQQLNGGPMAAGRYDSSNPFQFRILNRPYSRQEPDHIKIAHSHRNSVAQYVHEWAHFIANKNGRQIYSQYQNRLGGGSNFCMVSGYADGTSDSSHASRWSEQFAEAFTAFVTEPSLLLNNGSAACRNAYNFFKDELFNDGDRVSECL